MAHYGFGSGTLFSVVEGSNKTPRKFGTVQEVSVDISFNLKELHGQKKFPVAVAQGLGKIDIKVKAAEIYGRQWSEIVFGEAAVTTSQAKAIVEEAGTVPTTPYQITVAQAASFLEDLGVLDGSTGLAMTKVASSPATGQYSVSGAGVYTFAAADTTKAVKISYTHTATSTGAKFTVSNTDLGTQTFFALHLHDSYDGDAFYMKFYRCVSGKLALATKLEDFIIPEIDIKALADSSGNIVACGFGDQ